MCKNEFFLYDTDLVVVCFCEGFKVFNEEAMRIRNGD
jgi:hypothetical protein